MEKSETKRSEVIKNFMKKIDPKWSNLKKARYICINLCDTLYSYSPEFNYEDADFKTDYLGKIIKIFRNKDENEFKELIENEDQICVGLGNIYGRLLEQAGVPRSRKNWRRRFLWNRARKKYIC